MNSYWDNLMWRWYVQMEIKTDSKCVLFGLKKTPQVCFLIILLMQFLDWMFISSTNWSFFIISWFFCMHCPLQFFSAAESFLHWFYTDLLICHVFNFHRPGVSCLTWRFWVHLEDFWITDFHFPCCFI